MTSKTRRAFLEQSLLAASAWARDPEGDGEIRVYPLDNDQVRKWVDDVIFMETSEDEEVEE